MAACLPSTIGGDTGRPGQFSVAARLRESAKAAPTHTNTYNVVVVASDVALVSDSLPRHRHDAGYHKVTVMVTKVNEPGKIDLGHQTPQVGRRNTWSAQP